MIKMIHKKYIFIASLLVINCAYGMVGAAITEPKLDEELWKYANGHKRQPIPGFQELVSTIPNQEIIIIGADVATPCADSEQVNLEQFCEAHKLLLAENPRSPIELKMALIAINSKKCVFRDASQIGTRKTTLREYLLTASTPELAKSYIEYVSHFNEEQACFLGFYIAANLASVAIFEDGLTSLSADDTKHAQALLIFSTLIVNAQTRAALYETFGLQVPTTPIAYAAHIARTKQMLAEFSQQQTLESSNA